MFLILFQCVIGITSTNVTIISTILVKQFLIVIVFNQMNLLPRFNSITVVLFHDTKYKKWNQKCPTHLEL